jgi:hypothetical protein
MIAISFILAMSFSFVDSGCDQPRIATDAPAPDQFLIVPLRIHVLRTPDLDLANCELENADIERVVRSLNTIWRKAGIVFAIESIVREAAVQRERFQLIVQLNEGQIGLPEFQLLLPKPSRAMDGLHAYFFHSLPFNGAYLGEETVVLQEGVELNAVAGGVDDPMARVLGHCFGRTFGLRPREGPPSSLLALGTTGGDLDSGEIDRARRVARTIKGVLTVADARKAAEAAEAAGRTEQAKLVRSWLDTLSAPAGPDAKKECSKPAATSTTQDEK